MPMSFLELAAPGIRGLQPYQPGKPISELQRDYGLTDVIKLASNENPLGPPVGAVTAIAAASAEMARYPDGNGFELKQALASRHRVGPECVTLGNGSNDVLVLLAESFLGPGLEAVYSRYAFAVYPIAVQASGAQHRIAEAHPANHVQAYGHDLEAMAALVGPGTRLVFIANPNNPTGTWLDAAALEGFIRALPEEVVIVVDEAYFEYVQEPAYPDTSRWLQQFPNLVVTRTFSKVYGLAGLRVGYALSSPEIADILNRIRQPFNTSSIAQVAAIAALEDSVHVARSVELNRKGLQRVGAACSALGLGVGPSAGNFLLVDMQSGARPFYEALLRKGVIVRPVANYGLPNHLRISIGLPEENERLIAALGEVVKG